jgi:hypothetical protein
MTASLRTGARGPVVAHQEVRHCRGRGGRTRQTGARQRCVTRSFLDSAAWGSVSERVGQPTRGFAGCATALESVRGAQ